MRKIIHIMVICTLFSVIMMGCSYSQKQNNTQSDNANTKNIFSETTETGNNLSDNSKQESKPSSQTSKDVPQESNLPVQISREEPSQMSKDEPQISEEPSQVSKDEPQISEEPSQVSKDEPQIREEPSQMSKDEPQISEEPSQVSKDEPQTSDEPSEISDIPVDNTSGSDNDNNIIIQSNLKNTLNPICQYPELPTGCEVTALATVLQYYGFNADKCDLADNYLDKGPVGTVDFHTAFPGDPRNKYSYGCYAPAIVTAANRYLEKQDTELKAYDITGIVFEELFSYTEKNIPVIVWCTIDLKPGHYTTTWNIDGKDITWYASEHCMVLLGQGGNYVYAADPTTGTIETYSKNLMETRYKELFEQAVIIY